MVENKKENNSSRKQRDVTITLALIAIVLLLNFIGSFVFKRFDLTAEKRFTLADSTRSMLKGINDEILFKVYFEGNFNPGFTRLKNEAREMLDQFRIYSNGNIQYEFIDPADESLSPEERNNIQSQLYEKGLMPEDVFENKGDKQSATRIWPGAIVSYKGKEAVWQIFNRQEAGVSADVCINNSVNDLEYSLSNTIRLLQRIKKPEVTFIEGHYEPDTLHKYEFMKALAEYYTVNRTRIQKGNSLNALKGSDAIVITKPDTTFSDQEKFVIDQFIMNGGKVLWLIDPVSVNMDTLMMKGYSLGLNRPLNIEDMLFKYGVRINPELVQDMQCTSIPLNTGFKGGTPNYTMFRWVYSLQVAPGNDHPITKNLDLLKMDYVSPIDTISTHDIKKTILLTSSRASRIQPTPARIFLASASYPIKESQFKERYLPLAVLLEGTFKSFLEFNRIPSVFLNNPDFKILDHSKPTKMIVIGDGDIACNEIQRRTGRPYPLGYDIYSRPPITYGNKSFLVNCMNYLLDDQGLLQLRSREVKLRLLDRKKAKLQRSKWQMVNVGFPFGLILLMGAIFTWIRQRKYTA
jgi:gliding-associated putative ABC transporter substrate-binding component GldG